MGSTGVNGATGAENDEEVRLAVALNGGVSLAVWMGGCAVELDCARRARHRTEAVGVDAAPEEGALASLSRHFLTGKRAQPRPPDAAPPERVVYNALCSAFGRRLVIDVMSGTSAGGINGALLAAAIRWGRRLHPDLVRERWLELGDFGRVLHRTSNPAPHSLLQGQTLHTELKAVFDVLKAGEDPRTRWDAPGADPDESKAVLDVTTTAVAGSRRTFVDAWDEPFEAREYRARFAFREQQQFEPDLLAEAARSSASFPVAFEPWQLSCEAAALASLKGTPWVIDGGLLDNAPIRAALDLIPSRSAVREVERYVCYVDPDPPDPVPDAVKAGEPSLPAIAGYVTGLPRKATLVDQLYAVRGASSRSQIGRDAEFELLVTLDRSALVASAKALLPAYRRRRALLSLEEILGGPSEAKSAMDRLGNDGRLLPWIPSTLPDSASWDWGVRAAQRGLHLLIDVLRQTASRVAGAGQVPTLQARAAIDEQLRYLEQERRNLLSNGEIKAALRGSPGDDASPAQIGEQLSALTVGHREQVLTHIRAAGEATLGVSAHIAAVAGPELPEALFGQGWQTGRLDRKAFDHLLEGLMAVEVLRRAFFAEQDIETGEPLRFVQLTPRTRVPVFALDEASAPATEDAKLTGIHLGHFAAFYRRSWRVNDFMWGRLDAAARIVEMLVPTQRDYRSAEGHAARDAAANGLAAALVPDAGSTEDQRWLIAEALQGGPVDEVPAADALRADLRHAIKEDLTGGGDLTRLVCTRAAQLEILGHELPLLVESSRQDERLGSATAALQLQTDPPLRPAIGDLRDGDPLPVRLGRDNPDELASPLALRTLAHAALVSLAALRATKLPLTNLLYAARTVVLPVAGMVARAPVYRLGMAVGFWAAAVFLAIRMLTIDPILPPDPGLLIAKDTILALLAVLVVLGVALVPAVRFARSSSWRKLPQAGAAGVFLASGGGLALLLAHFSGEVRWASLVVAPGAEGPPDVVTGVAIALVAGPIAAGLIPGLRDAFTGVIEKPWAGWTSFGTLMVVAAVVIGTSFGELLDGLAEGGWRAWTAAAAFAALPFAVAYAFFPNPVRRLRRRQAA